MNPDGYTLLPLWYHHLLPSSHSFRSSLTGILDILQTQEQRTCLRAFVHPDPSPSTLFPHTSTWLVLHIIHTPSRSPPSLATLFKTVQPFPSHYCPYILLCSFPSQQLPPDICIFFFCCLPPPLERKLMRAAVSWLPALCPIPT